MAEPDTGVYGPVCLECGERLSSHEAFLDTSAPSDRIEARFSNVKVKGLYCPLPNRERKEA
jgi:hypothetical protein